ncbi:MAG TPA: SRPBCC family protein [Acidimicrobiia bacterium]|nr:SRPBCC family protein [Acidimicrobiia bacterium]
MSDHVATASTVVEAPKEEVWEALTDPDLISRYMFGTEVSTDWEVGSPITWKGEWDGRSYQDKGTILELKPRRLLRYSHFSPLSGMADSPENYHTVTIEIAGDGSTTTVHLSQDNNETPDAREHSAANCQTMLDGLKDVVEARV